MKFKIVGFLFLSLAATAHAASSNTLAVIPLPQQIELRDGVFQLTSGTRIYTDQGSRETAQFLTERLRPSTGLPLKTSTKSLDGSAIAGGILLTTRNADAKLGAEGYELTVET